MERLAYIVLLRCPDKEDGNDAFPGTRSLSATDRHGCIFFAHGSVKWQRGLEATADSFVAMGLPGLLAYIVTIIELAGGWTMMLGLGTRPIAAAFAVIMIGAIATAKADAGLLGNGRETGYEFNLALLAMSILFMAEWQPALVVRHCHRAATGLNSRHKTGVPQGAGHLFFCLY